MAIKQNLCDFDDQEEHDYDNHISELEIEWKKSIPEIRKKISEFINEQLSEFKIECLKNYLETLKVKIKKKEDDYIQEYKNNIPQWLRVFSKNSLIKKLKEIKKIQMKISFSSNSIKKDGISDEMIENAKKYPIEKLIEINDRNFALCPFHQDKKPSLFCRNNFYYCFTCQSSGSVIDLYMHLYNCNFIEAVKQLQ